MMDWIARMLEPDGRVALTEQLRPPSGFQLAHAVATTFSLDLTTALSVPLAFAAHRVHESRDPIAILDAVRRAADKIDVFAQAGQIFEPRIPSDLFALLEPMIHPASAPRLAMLFHPKVWILEYADGDARSYRLLCASRNLTNDRSWDLVVRLDGLAGDEPTEQSAPLAAFVRALPEMSVQSLTDRRTARIGELANSIAKVEWELPSDVRSLRFHPYGVPGVIGTPIRELFDGTRHGIISPFLSDGGIRRILPQRSESVIILALREQLDRLDSATLERVEALILDDAANDGDVEDDGERAKPELLTTPRAEPLVGLHAKAYVVDRQSGSHLFVGSANATEAAFGGNVEMLVEFEGPYTKLGVLALLGETSPLRALTIPFEPVGNAEVSDDELADYELEQTLRALAARRYFAQVESGASASAETDYLIGLSADGPVRTPEGMSARVTLLTRPANTAVLPGEPVIFDRLALTDITPFIVIRVSDSRGATASTVVTAALKGDIPGRQDAVIARQLEDRAAFLKLLALLLALEGGDGLFHFDSTSGLGAEWAEDGSGIFETLVRAIGVEHGGLADLRRIVEHVKAAEMRRPEGAPPVLPDGFDELWESVWAAYSSLTRVR
ncbi:phospholipase D family protein [Mycolicibacterium celeriflavum]|uniref:phospholipase D family protein n=1 Tax=Mycolicibacterium celeriflavum TaxID=1249101 RepID=UPI003CEC476E